MSDLFITILTYLVPISLIGYIAIKCRKSILWVCALPLGLTLGDAIFFPWDFSLDLPGFPYPLERQDVIFFTLCLAWFIASQKRPQVTKFKLSLVGIALFIFTAVVFFQIPLAWINDHQIRIGVIWAMHTWVYLPFGFWIWFDILRRTTRPEIDTLLKSLAFSSILLAGLYILSVSGLMDIYSHSNYYSELHYGQPAIIRNASAFPFYLKLSLAWLLTGPLLDPLALAGLATAFLAVFFSYTRSWIIPSLIIVAIGTAYLIRKSKRKLHSVATAVFFLFILAGGIVLFQSLFSSNFNFLISRLTETQTFGLNTPNLQVRIDTFQVVFNAIQRVDTLFGMGFSTLVSIKPVQSLYLGDTLWSWVLFPLGLSGVIAVALVFGCVLLTCLTSLVKNRVADRLDWVLLMIIIWDIIRSFTSVDNLLIYVFGTGFFMALATVQRQKIWAVAPVTLAHMPIFKGINLNVFTLKDRWYFVRRTTFVLLSLLMGILVGRFISR